jgi:3'(2'), 5'-bisphosphate nucleotidase
LVVADLAVQAILVNGIRECDPSNSIIAEEDLSSIEEDSMKPELVTILSEIGLDLLQCTKTEYKTLPSLSRNFWTVDPIDGTKGFLRNDQYAICVSFVESGTVTCSLISCPNLSGFNGRGSLFMAFKGFGAHEFSLHSQKYQRLGPKTVPLAGSKLSESFDPGHSSHGRSSEMRAALGMCPDPLRMDSQAKYCLLARNEVALFFRSPSHGYVEKIWDHAPGSLMVVETGGQVTDFQGHPIRLDGPYLNSVMGGILATKYAKEDHEKVIQYLNKN